jgi:hypothetical protein
MANEKTIKFGLPTGKFFDSMRSIELLYAEGGGHGSASKTDGSRNSRSMRAWRRGDESFPLLCVDCKDTPVR